MTTTKSLYKGDLRVRTTHIGSASHLTTDAPLDNHGRGESFSPTDLVGAALASCMLTIIGIAAKTHGFDITGTEVEVTKIMTAEPRRIGELVVDIHLPDDKMYSTKERRLIEAAARQCPVALSLREDLKQTISFIYR